MTLPPTSPLLLTAPLSGCSCAPEPAPTAPPPAPLLTVLVGTVNEGKVAEKGVKGVKEGSVSEDKVGDVNEDVVYESYENEL